MYLRTSCQRTLQAANTVIHPDDAECTLVQCSINADIVQLIHHVPIAPPTIKQQSDPAVVFPNADPDRLPEVCTYECPAEDTYMVHSTGIKGVEDLV